MRPHRASCVRVVGQPCEDGVWAQRAFGANRNRCPRVTHRSRNWGTRQYRHAASTGNRVLAPVFGVGVFIGAPDKRPRSFPHDHGRGPLPRPLAGSERGGPIARGTWVGESLSLGWNRNHQSGTRADCGPSPSRRGVAEGRGEVGGNAGVDDKPSPPPSRWRLGVVCRRIVRSSCTGSSGRTHGCP